MMSFGSIDKLTHYTMHTWNQPIWLSPSAIFWQISPRRIFWSNCTHFPQLVRREEYIFNLNTVYVLINAHSLINAHLMFQARSSYVQQAYYVINQVITWPLNRCTPHHYAFIRTYMYTVNKIGMQDLYI